MQNNSKIILGGGNLLAHDPQHLRNIYGVAIHYVEKEIRLHYEIDIRFIKREDDGIVVYRLDRKQVWLNNEMPGNKGMLYEIADEMAKAIYPLSIHINTKREITRLVNHPEIMARCQEVLKKMAPYYTGETAENITYQFERHSKSETRVMAGLEKDLFFKLYFFPLYTRYSNDLSAETDFDLSLAKNGDTCSFHISLQLEPSYSGTGKLVANLIGKEIPQENGRTKPDMPQSFKAQYQLYPEDHIIFSITGEATYMEEGEKQTVRFEMYHMNTEDRKITQRSTLLGGQRQARSEDTSNIVVDVQTEPNKKKSFFNFFK